MMKTKLLINMRKIFFFPASYVSGNREKIIIYEEKKEYDQRYSELRL